MPNNVIQFADIVNLAKTCDVTAADILSEHDLMVANMEWNNASMQAQAEAMLIRHERALEKFSKKAA